MCFKLFQQRTEDRVLSEEYAKRMVADILNHDQQMFHYRVSKHKNKYRVVRFDGTTRHVHPVYVIKTEYLTEKECQELDTILSD